MGGKFVWMAIETLTCHGSTFLEGNEILLIAFFYEEIRTMITLKNSCNEGGNSYSNITTLSPSPTMLL